MFTLHSWYIIIHPASLPVVAGAALTIEDWSVSEGTQVREEVTRTTGYIACSYTATADHDNIYHVAIVYYFTFR